MLPAVVPYTTPVLDIVATVLLLLLQVPPGVASLNAIVPPGHTVLGPMIADAEKQIVTEPSPVFDPFEYVADPTNPVADAKLEPPPPPPLYAAPPP